MEIPSLKVTEDDIRKAKESWNIERLTKTPNRVEWDYLTIKKQDDLIYSKKVARVKQELHDYFVNRRKINNGL